MDTRKAGRQNVYAAAEAWVRRALRSDDSLFTPGRPIWTSEWLDELHRRFLDSPDVSDTPFWDKLERQMAGSPPQAYQLMTEVLYVHLIVVSRKDSTGVQAQLQQVLNWSPQPMAIPSEFVAGLTPGIANPGQGFHRYRPHQVGLVIEFASQWKQLGPDECQRLLDDPWAFKDFVMHVDLRSALFRDYPVNPRIQQHALLHLVHPDTFEPIVSFNSTRVGWQGSNLTCRGGMARVAPSWATPSTRTLPIDACREPTCISCSPTPLRLISRAGSWRTRRVRPTGRRTLSDTRASALT